MESTFYTEPNPNLEFDLGFHVHHLLMGEPFFAKVSRHMRKVPNYNIPTLGVRFDEDRSAFEMVYNPKFLRKVLDQHPQATSQHNVTEGMRLIKAALMHEYYHCSLGHLTDRKKADLPPDIQNVLMDWAINSLPGMLEDMQKFTWKNDPNQAEPSRCCLPEQHGLPNAESFEWYAANMPEDFKKEMERREKAKQNQPGGGQPGPGQPGDGYTPHDSHDGFGSGQKDESEGGSSEAQKQIAASKMKEIIERATQECDQENARGINAWGTVPQEMRKKIRDAFKSPLNPKSVIRYFVKTSERADRRSSITKINRRYAYVHPGRRWSRRPKIAISMDMSGSVGDELLAKFFGWLNEFATFADFTVIPFDHVVFDKNVFHWKKGQKRPAIRVQCGGTDFNAPTAYVNERDFDGHIVLTDLCAPTPQRSKCQRLWVTSKSNLAYRSHIDPTGERILCVD